MRDRIRRLPKMFRDALLISEHFLIGLVLFQGWQGGRVILFEHNPVVLAIESVLFVWILYELLHLLEHDTIIGGDNI